MGKAGLPLPVPGPTAAFKNNLFFFFFQRKREKIENCPQPHVTAKKIFGFYPVSHPDCLGGRLQWGHPPAAPFPGFQGGLENFLNSHTNSGQSPHQPEPEGFSHFFPPGLTSPCSRSLLSLQVCIQKHSSASPARVPPHPPFRADQGHQGGLYKYINILFYFLFRVFFCFRFVFIFNSFQ